MLTYFICCCFEEFVLNFERALRLDLIEKKIDTHNRSDKFKN